MRYAVNVPNFAEYADVRAAALAVVEPLAEAGMTWWTESLEPHRGGLEEMRRRVRQGPPRR